MNVIAMIVDCRLDPDRLAENPLPLLELFPSGMLQISACAPPTILTESLVGRPRTSTLCILGSI